MNDDVTGSREYDDIIVTSREVNDDAGDVDDGDAEENATDACTALNAQVQLAMHICTNSHYTALTVAFNERY